MQALILWVVSLPVFEAVRHPEPDALTAPDSVGILVFAVGLFFGPSKIGSWPGSRPIPPIMARSSIGACGGTCSTPITAAMPLV